MKRKIYLMYPLGKLKTGIGYEVKEEGKDFFLLKNGIYVEKNLTTDSLPDKSPEDEFTYFGDSYDEEY